MYNLYTNSSVNNDMWSENFTLSFAQIPERCESEYWLHRNEKIESG